MIMLMIIESNIFIYKIITVINFSFVLYGLIAWLNLKLDQIAMSIHLHIHWRNKVNLFNAINEYDQLTRLITDISIVINFVNGLLYLCTPYCFSVALNILKWHAHTLLGKCLQIACIVVFIIVLLCICLMNYMMGSITTRNKSITKYLYRAFTDTKFINHNKKLLFYNTSNTKLYIKIDNLIARINEQYVGFYCFNMFELTKRSFYEYILALFVSHIFINDLIN